MRSSRGTAALAVAAAVTLASGCGRGEKASPPEVATTTETTLPETTTTTTDEEELRKLLLVAADVPEFKEQSPPADAGGDDDDLLAKCEDQLPALKALDEDAQVEGDTFVRGPEDGVKVSSSVASTTPGKAEAALDELQEAKAATCLETAFRDSLKDEVPEGTEVTPKASVTKSSVAGADQVVLVSLAGTGRARGQALGFRHDIVLLRRGGEIVIVNYAGPTNLTSVAERQRIVAAISKKLGGDTTATTASGGTTSTTASSGASTTRRSTTTTRASTTSSSRASTTTTTTP